MKTKFMVNGSNISVIKLNEDTALDHLPARVYTLQFDKFMGFYLSITKDSLQVPAKIYGSTDNRVEKCVKTYTERSRSTGILLTGDKGTGKTLLMSLLANTVMKELSLPVILIKEPYEGEQFTSFVESIGECCLIFDEFGKMYSNSNKNSDDIHQESLLSLMDGVDKTKRLIIMSENNVFDINEFMLNRPSRIYYHFKYSKLGEDSITDYCMDYDISNDVTKDIIELSRSSKIFSFDMLQSIIEEYLRFNMSIVDVVEDLNVDLSKETMSTIEIMKVVSRENKTVCNVVESSIVIKPKSDYVHFYLQPANSNKSATELSSYRPDFVDDDDDDNITVYISQKDLKYEAAGNLVYETDKYTITAKELPQTMVNYRCMF